MSPIDSIYSVYIGVRNVRVEGEVRLTGIEPHAWGQSNRQVASKAHDEARHER